MVKFAGIQDFTISSCLAKFPVAALVECEYPWSLAEQEYSAAKELLPKQIIEKTIVVSALHFIVKSSAAISYIGIPQ